MMRPSTCVRLEIFASGLCACGLLLFSACGSKQPAAANAPAPAPKPGAAAAKADTNAAPAAPKITKSVFVIDPKTSRDPFFPNAKYAQPSAAGGTNQPPKGDVLSALELKDVWALGGNKVAWVNGVGLEQGKTAVVPVFLDGREQRVRVQCLRINNNGSVDLKVEGLPQPVQLKKLKR